MLATKIKNKVLNLLTSPKPTESPKNKFVRVIIESRYRDSHPGQQEYYKQFAFACMEDCLRNYNEAGFASHCNYTNFLNEESEAERNLGILAGFAWREAAEKSVVYTNLGTSPGVEWGIQDSIAKGKPVEYRTLPPDLFHAFHEKNKHLLPGQDTVEPANSTFFDSSEHAGEFVAALRQVR